MTDKNRRKFVTMMGASVVAVPVTSLIGTLPSHAQDMVDPASDQAIALQYVAESITEGQMCGNCTLFQGDDTGGACPLFPGSKVPAAAWCSAYTPKA